MRTKTGICKVLLLVVLTLFCSGCVEAFLDGLSRGFADGVAFIVADFVSQLPGQTPPE